MKEIVVCVLCIYSMAFFREVSNGQSIQLEYLSDQCVTPETMLFKVTLNTTNATDYTFPYAIELYAYIWRVCQINISSEGCFSGSRSSFSYSVQQEQDNCFISITVSTRQNFIEADYHYYYNNFASAFCVWRGPNTVWSSNIVRLPLFSPEFDYNGHNMVFDFKYSLVDKSSPSSINATSILFNYWGSTQHANLSFVIGNENIKLDTIFYSHEFRMNVSQLHDMTVFDEETSCSYICDGLDVSVSSLEFQYVEEGNLTNLTFSIPAMSNFIFNKIYVGVEKDPGLFKGTDFTEHYDVILRKYSMSFRSNMDWSSHLAFRMFYAYNTTFCRTKEQNAQRATPRAVISSDCPSGSGVKNGYIRLGTIATCKCQMVGQSNPAAYVQWFTEDGRSVASPGEISDLVLSSDTTGIFARQNNFHLNMYYMCEAR